MAALNPVTAPSSEADRPSPLGLAASLWYPTGLLVASVLAVFVTTSISPYALGRPLLLAALLGPALTVLGVRLTHDCDRGGLSAGLVATAVVGGSLAIIAAAAPLAALVVWDARRAADRRLAIRWALVARVLSTATFVFLVALGIRGLQDGRIEDALHDLTVETRLPLSSTETAIAAGNHPDIYLVLLDGYLRPDKQAELFGGDASTFVRALEERGFDVADRSRSNYLRTDLSLVSMLNMKHVLALVDDDRRGALPDYDPRYLINEGDALITARQFGYEVVGISAGWEELSLRQADRFIDPGVLNEAEYAVLARSALRPILDLFARDLVADWRRSAIQGSLRTVAEIASTPSRSPRLVFAHVPAPHSPFVFGAGGERLPGFPLEQLHDGLEAAPGGAGSTEYERAYLGQARHVSRLAIEAVDQIIRVDSDAVIIVFSDHGSGAGYTPWHPPDTDLDERTSILVATRTPSHPNLVPDNVTLVNVLPTIVDAYLGTHHDQSTDEIYPPGEGPFGFGPPIPVEEG